MATLRIGRSRRIWAGLLLVVVAGCAGAGGCGGDKPPLSGTPAGDAISRHDLALMMLPPDELGMDSLEVSPASGRESNAHAAERSLDPDDTGRDIRKRGRIDGYFVTYLPAGALLMSDPDIHIIGAVELFREESQASDWIDAQIGAFEDVASGDLDAELDYEIDSLQISAAKAAGKDARGLTYSANNDGETVSVSVVFLHEGRIAATVLSYRSDDRDVLAEMAAIGAKLRARIEGVVRGEVTGEPIAIPEWDDVSGDTAEGRVLGLRCSYASRFLREKYQLGAGRGCVVLRVDANSGAERAGLRIGDKIIRLDGRPITSGRQFTYEFEERPRPRGSTRTFVVERGGREMTFEVTLGRDANPPAEDPYADYLVARGNPDTAEAIEYFSRAIAQEPSFDLAYLYRGEKRRNFSDSAGAVPVGPGQGEDDILRALELDPDLAEAHESRAHLIGFDFREFDAAFEHLDRATEIAGCATPVPDWDLDCAHFGLTRAQLYVHRNAPGDLELAEGTLDSIDEVEGIARELTETRLSLRYAREEVEDHTCEVGPTEVPCSLLDGKRARDVTADERDVRRLISANSGVSEAHYRLAELIAQRGGEIGEMIQLIELAYTTAPCGPGSTVMHCPKYTFARAQAYMVRGGADDLEKARAGFEQLDGTDKWGPGAAWALRRLDQIQGTLNGGSLRASAEALKRGACLVEGIEVPCVFVETAEHWSPESIDQQEASVRLIINANPDERMGEAHYRLAKLIALRGGDFGEVLEQLQFAYDDALCDDVFSADQCGKYIFARALTSVLRGGPGDRDRAIVDLGRLSQYVQWHDAALAELRRLESTP